MSSQNPDSKKIDIGTDEGLELLRIKAKYYGYYAEQLRVVELIEEVERLRADAAFNSEWASHEAAKKLGW